MDLGICPGCGQNWIVGTERCEHCGYVPIGVGVREAAQAQREQQQIIANKKKRRPVVMPVGSWPGYLVTLIAFLGLAFAADATPWRNDWEFVRVLFGDETSKSLAGSWYISKGEGIDTSGLPVSQDTQVKGFFNFTEGGQVDIDLDDPSGKGGAEGDYAIHGSIVYLRNLQNGQGSSRTLPQNIIMSVTWLAGDEVVLDVSGHEVLYLRRTSDSASNLRKR